MKIVSCIENGRCFELHGPKNWEIKKIKIDGDVIKGNQTEKCDYAITVRDSTPVNHALFYVELKGKDLLKAISQLESTVIQLKSEFNGFKSHEAHAVCRRIIPYVQASAQVQAVNFKKKYGFLLRWHSQKAVIVIKD